MEFMEAKPQKHYSSPRWTGEITDCSLPMTLDTYSCCSYNCLYCFAFFQKAISVGKDYQRRDVTWVNVPRVIELLTSPEKVTTAGMGTFAPYLISGRAFQWGGMSDPFDENERKNGKTLEILRAIRGANRQICFSTKGTWWTEDERYCELFRNNPDWNVKISIISLNEQLCKKMESGCPSPQSRLSALKRIAELNCGGATLRLRPFVVGLTNLENDHVRLIDRAADNGASAVSTEFLCLERRADEYLLARYKKIQEALNFDLFGFYREKSKTGGYMRLCRSVKERFMLEMKKRCDARGLRFYVSDAHFKELCHNGSCCGLPEEWRYSRGQFTEALMIAKKKGEVRWSDIDIGCEFMKKIPVRLFNLNSTIISQRKMRTFSIYDLIKNLWNDPNQGKSPYKYFHGALVPTGLDEELNVIYRYAAPR
jgi:DNA repair photolyase